MDSSSGLPSLLMQAAQSAAEADGVGPPTEIKKEEAATAAAAAGEDGGIQNGPIETNDRNELLGTHLTGSEAGGGLSAVGNNTELNEILATMKNGAPPNQSQVTSIMGGSAAAMSAGVDSAIAIAASSPAIAQTQQTIPQSQSVEPAAPAPVAEPKKRAPLRRGKWTPEEEAYANRLIQEFKAGLLPLTDGTTLRTFLSKLLNCDPMRISKKFVGSNCIGKQVFRRRGADVNNLTPDEIEKTRYELSELEKKFLDRVAQNKSSKGTGSSTKSNKLGSSMPSSGGGGLGGMNNNMNKSAAAVGRALLQGSKAPQQQSQGNSTDGGDSSAGGLLAQLQAQQPGMFDSTTARSFLNATGGSQTGGLGNTNTNPSITNLMLQTGMSRDQISQLAQKGISSSASLANMLGKQRSFDQLMSLDFQSMQSIDNLANLIQAGMPNQASGLARGAIPKAQMKNVDWGASTGPQGSTFGNAASNAATSLLAPAGGSGSLTKGSLENLVRTLSGNSGQGSAAGSAPVPLNLNNKQANATNFSSFLQNATQQNNNLVTGGQGGQSNDLNNLLQSLQQQQQQQHGNNVNNFGNLLQGMGGASLLQNNNTPLLQSSNTNNMGQGLGQNNNGGNNDLMNMLGQSMGNNQQNLNPLVQHLNDPFGGLQNATTNQGNPMMAALAQQQLLAQAGGGNGMVNLLGPQNGLGGLGVNNSLGNFGATLGGNFGGNLGSGLGGSMNFGAGGGNNTAALLQQLIAQQGSSSGTNNNSQVQGASGGAEGNARAGHKRSLEDMKGGGGDDGEGGPAKKQQTVSL